MDERTRSRSEPAIEVLAGLSHRPRRQRICRRGKTRLRRACRSAQAFGSVASAGIDRASTLLLPMQIRRIARREAPCGRKLQSAQRRRGQRHPQQHQATRFGAKRRSHDSRKTPVKTSNLKVVTSFMLTWPIFLSTFPRRRCCDHRRRTLARDSAQQATGVAPIAIRSQLANHVTRYSTKC